jgi:hypothetical protein
MTTIPDTVSTFVRFIQLKSLRDRTKEEYVRWVTRLARQGGVACPSLLGQEEVLAFLHDLQQNHGYEGSTVNQAVCALRLFFREHLGRADWTCWAQIRIKRTAPLPTVLSREEMRGLLGAGAAGGTGSGLHDRKGEGGGDEGAAVCPAARAFPAARSAAADHRLSPEGRSRATAVSTPRRRVRRCRA